ncbi:hypothetical protein HJ581_0041785 [Rhodococcus opacus]|nr:hypothetical protein HJ581_0041785 [Rhodococcus opacus]
MPQRNEALAQLQLWVDRIVPTLPAQHQPVIRAYAEWHIVRRARLRSARRPFRPGADAANRQRIQCAINFLSWLADAGSSIGTLAQHHVDTYFATGPSNARALGTFLAWMQARRLITGIEIPREKDGLPQRFQDYEDHAEQLRRCLTDDELPLEVRIVGALIRLYAMRVTRIVELTCDRFHRDDTHAYLVIEQNAVVLPPSLAALFDELIRRRRSGGRAYSGPGGASLDVSRQAAESTPQHNGPAKRPDKVRAADADCPQLGDDRQHQRPGTSRGQRSVRCRCEDRTQMGPIRSSQLGHLPRRPIRRHPISATAGQRFPPPSAVTLLTVFEHAPLDTTRRDNPGIAHQLNTYPPPDYLPGGLRHPSFKGQRGDLDPGSITRDAL